MVLEFITFSSPGRRSFFSGEIIYGLSDETQDKRRSEVKGPLQMTWRI